MSTKFKVLLASVLAILCSFYSLNVSAIDLTQNVSFQESVQSPYFKLDFTDSTSSGWVNSSFTNTTSRNTSYISLRGANNTKPSSISSGRFVSAVMRFMAPGDNSKWNTRGVFTVGVTDVSCPIVDIDDFTSQMHTDSNMTEQWSTVIVTCKYTGSGDITVPINIRSSGSINYNWRFVAASFTIWSPSNAASSSDVEAVTNAVNSMKTAINNKLDTTNNKLDTLNVSINDLKAAQEQANDDANDRYEDEKNEINTNANQGKEDSESLGNISLSLLNPLNAWKNYFTNGCSVNIPIIAGWINSPSTTYSSWWCTDSKLQGIKSVLTGVLSIVGVMIVFGFAFKWLRTNNGED